MKTRDNDCQNDRIWNQINVKLFMEIHFPQNAHEFHHHFLQTRKTLLFYHSNCKMSFRFRKSHSILNGSTRHIERCEAMKMRQWNCTKTVFMTTDRRLVFHFENSNEKWQSKFSSLNLRQGCDDKLPSSIDSMRQQATGPNEFEENVCFIEKCTITDTKEQKVSE